MFNAIKQSAAHAARKAGLLTGGLLCVVVGAGFLTAAAWIYLAATLDPLAAASIIGGVYAGLGLILIGIASSKAPGEGGGASTRATAQGRAETRAASAENVPPLMQAFLFGLQAGTSAPRRPE